MEYLVNAAQMRRCDENTSSHFGILPAVLMERAALACLEVLRERFFAPLENGSKCPCGRRVLVVAGSGNNGGDGFALGRLLMLEGCPVDFVLIGQEETANELTAGQIRSVRAYGGRIEERLPDRAYDIIVDALFGVGLSRELTGAFREAVDYINRQDAFVLSVDLPSGIHADTGRVMGAAVQADVTVTFGFRKLGLVLYPGARYAGSVVCAPIGITEHGFLGQYPSITTYEGPVADLLPKRPSDGNKGTFGKIALLAGSDGMEGAGLLCAYGAFGAGCGMVKLVGTERMAEACLRTLPEVMVTDQDGAACTWADVIGAGPGLSVGADAASRIASLLETAPKPLVLDADAINILAADSKLLKRLEGLQAKEASRRVLVLTPHPGELARLDGCGIAEVLENPMGVALRWAKRLQAVVLCKGARTVVASFDGQIYLNTSGNSGMATAGSGDVLTGILAALLAGPQTPFQAVCAGVYLHGRAGDLAAARKGERSMTAGDLAEMIPLVLLEREKGNGAI